MFISPEKQRSYNRKYRANLKARKLVLASLVVSPAILDELQHYKRYLMAQITLGKGN